MADGIFYLPPPPVVSATGAQPDAPNKLPPSIEAAPIVTPPAGAPTLPNTQLWYTYP